MRLEQEDRLISKDVEIFTDYFNSFYGVNGIYPYRDTEAEDILMAIKIVLKDRPDYKFVGGADSVDRETIRDIVFSQLDLAYIYND